MDSKSFEEPYSVSGIGRVVAVERITQAGTHFLKKTLNLPRSIILNTPHCFSVSGFDNVRGICQLLFENAHFND